MPVGGAWRRVRGGLGAPDLRPATVELGDLPRSRRGEMCAGGGRVVAREEIGGVCAAPSHRSAASEASTSAARSRTSARPVVSTALASSHEAHSEGRSDPTPAAMPTVRSEGCARRPKAVWGPPPPITHIFVVPSGNTRSSTMTVKTTASTAAAGTRLETRRGRCGHRVETSLPGRETRARHGGEAPPIETRDAQRRATTRLETSRRGLRASASGGLDGGAVSSGAGRGKSLTFGCVFIESAWLENSTAPEASEPEGN